MTNAERQAAYRTRQAEKGRVVKTMLLTDDEAFFIERLLKTLRENPKSTPAMIRTCKGQLKPIDL